MTDEPVPLILHRCHNGTPVDFLARSLFTAHATLLNGEKPDFRVFTAQIPFNNIVCVRVLIPADLYVFDAVITRIQS